MATIKPKTNGIYYIAAEQVLPIGLAGAVIIAATPTRAIEIAQDIKLTNQKKPVKLGSSILKEQIVYGNNADV